MPVLLEGASKGLAWVFFSLLRTLGKEPKVPTDASEKSKVLFSRSKIQRGGLAYQRSSSLSTTKVFEEKEVHRAEK